MVHKLQNVWEDKRSCAQRRADRVPSQLRDMYAKTSRATSEFERRYWQRKAWHYLKAWRLELKTREVVCRFKRGCVITKSNKLLF